MCPDVAGAYICSIYNWPISKKILGRLYWSVNAVTAGKIVVSSTSRMSGVRTHNISGDWHWLHMQLESQLPYEHDHDGSSIYWGIDALAWQ